MVFGTDDIARLCGIEPVTLRGWLARAPAFKIGRREGRANTYTAADAAVFVLAAAILQHRLVRPSDAFPVAAHLARTDLEVAFLHVEHDGEITATAERPRIGHSFSVAPRGTREWIDRRAALVTGGPRIARAA